MNNFLLPFTPSDDILQMFVNHNSKKLNKDFISGFNCNQIAYFTKGSFKKYVTALEGRGVKQNSDKV